jgi:hypothetical protein
MFDSIRIILGEHREDMTTETDKRRRIQMNEKEV